MKFLFFSLLTSALSVSNVSAQLSAQDVVENINTITDLSRDTTDAAQNILGPQIFTAAPKLITGFKDIVSTVTMSITSMEENPPKDDFAEDSQKKICESFTNFVKVHQNLLEIVIGKGGILSSTPFTAPIAAVLRLLEKGVDEIAFGIIGLVPACEDKAMKDKKKLDGTLEDAIMEFS